MTNSVCDQVEPLTTAKHKTRTSLRSTGIRYRGLPEYATYRDTGCELAPACLECPLEICKYDDPHWGKRNLKARRNEEIVNLRAGGMSVAQIAATMDTSERTVYRVIKNDYYPIVETSRAA